MIDVVATAGVAALRSERAAQLRAASALTDETVVHMVLEAVEPLLRADQTRRALNEIRGEWTAKAAWIEGSPTELEIAYLHGMEDAERAVERLLPEGGE